MDPKFETKIKKKLIEIVRFGGSRHCQLVGLAPEIILHYLKSNLDGFEPRFGQFLTPFPICL